MTTLGPGEISARSEKSLFWLVWLSCRDVETESQSDLMKLNIHFSLDLQSCLLMRTCRAVFSRVLKKKLISM